MIIAISCTTRKEPKYFFGRAAINYASKSPKKRILSPELVVNSGALKLVVTHELFG
jgi:hypothetical protein